jgi:hypothetical protein
LEVDWHRTWCENHPINRQTSAWPPAMQAATPTGEWLNYMSQQSKADEGNTSGDILDNTPLIGLLSLGTGINMESMPSMFTTDEDEPQDEKVDKTLKDDTWNLIEDVLGESQVNQNTEVGTDQNVNRSEQGQVGPHTPNENSNTQSMKIDQMWVSANDLAHALARFVSSNEQKDNELNDESVQVQIV